MTCTWYLQHLSSSDLTNSFLHNISGLFSSVPRCCCRVLDLTGSVFCIPSWNGSAQFLMRPTGSQVCEWTDLTSGQLSSESPPSPFSKANRLRIPLDIIITLTCVKKKKKNENKKKNLEIIIFYKAEWSYSTQLSGWHLLRCFVLWIDGWFPVQFSCCLTIILPPVVIVCACVYVCVCLCMYSTCMHAHTYVSLCEVAT